VHDDYWRRRELNGRYDRVNAPAVHVGGWFDIFAQGTIDAFTGYQTKGGPKARGRQKLVMGPWTHGVLQDQAGDLAFPKGKQPPTRAHESWRWFDFHLKGVTNGVDREPAVTYYVMGDVSDTNAPGNVWRTASGWPPVNARPTRLYLHDDHALSTRSAGAAGAISFTYNPNDPTPTLGGPQLTLPAGPKDQRPIEGRPDVVLFTSEPLAAPMEITGRVRLRLWVASDAPDTDFFAKLCDVYPDGRSFNLCEGQLRARFRKTFRRQHLLEPGRIYPIEIDLGSTSMVFNRAHRLRLQVTSSSAPGFDPNPNTGEPFRASDRTRVARNTIHLGAHHPSHLLLPVVR
jgi:hypothetical protein